MKVTWLTQAGLLFENGKVTVLVDPYLSDSIGETLDPAKHRRVPVDESFFEKKPDLILITHDHLDHLDMQTLERYLDTDRTITVLAPENAWRKLVKYGHGHNYVLMNPHTVWSEKNLTFYSVKAAHSDPTAVGFIIDDGNATYYISGDTLYNYDVIDEVLELVEDGVDYAFLPINGVGNNMNAGDAADFAYEIGAKHAIPVHYGLFDSLDPRTFEFDDAMIFLPYRAVEL